MSDLGSVSDFRSIHGGASRGPAKPGRFIEPPLEEHLRPGRKPKVSDSDLSSTELERRNRRRQRNRECAKRACDRRNTNMDQLDSKVKNLENEKVAWKSKFAKLSAKLHGVKWRMIAQSNRNSHIK